MKKAIITVVGKDTVGIIAGVCTYLPRLIQGIRRRDGIGDDQETTA